MQRIPLILLAALLATAAAACGSSDADDPTPSPTTGTTATSTATTPASTGTAPTSTRTAPTATAASLPTQAPGEPVALVNGEAITRGQFDTRFAQASDAYANDGADVSTPQFQADLRRNLMERMIDELLVLQKAENAGYAADPAEVDTRFAEVVDNFETNEQFEAALAQNHLDAAQLRENIRTGIVIDTYIADHLENNVSESGLEPTEEELREAYETVISQYSGQVPTFEELSPNLRNQLRQLKRTEQIELMIDAIEAESEVEILI